MSLSLQRYPFHPVAPWLTINNAGSRLFQFQEQLCIREVASRVHCNPNGAAKRRRLLFLLSLSPLFAMQRAVKRDLAVIFFFV